MISENDREWSLECKLGTSTGNFTTIFELNQNDELKKGRFVYDKISKRFTTFHYDANHKLREQVVFLMNLAQILHSLRHNLEWTKLTLEPVFVQMKMIIEYGLETRKNWKFGLST